MKCEFCNKTGTRPADSLYWKCGFCGKSDNPMKSNDDKCGTCTKDRVPIDTTKICDLCFEVIGEDKDYPPIKLHCTHVFHKICLLDIVISTLKSPPPPRFVKCQKPGGVCSEKLILSDYSKMLVSQK